MTTRRTALVAALALVLLGLTVSPAAAAPASTRHTAGHLTPLYRAPSGTPSRTPALRRDSVVSGDPATVKQSVWQVTYTSGFTGHDNAKAAFQAAVDIWASIVHSTVPIRVHADFKDLGDPNLLGQAGPGGYNQDPSIGNGVSYYPDALSDSLAGTDVYPAEFDIYAEFNSGAGSTYYGTDGVIPDVNDVDFESIVLHELGHGLGFSGSSYYDGGSQLGSWDCQTVGPSFPCAAKGYEIYDTFLEQTNGAKLTTTYANDSTALGTAYLSPVFWGGANGKAANGGSHVRMYTPNPWEAGSSIAHMDESTYPAGDVNSLMTPFLSNNEVVHRPGPVILGIFQDMGWITTLDVPGKVTGVTTGTASGEIDLSWTAPAENGSKITGYKISQKDDTTVTTTALTSTTTSKQVTGLDAAHTYEFTVQATNAVGDGPASDSTGPVSPTPDTTPPTVSFTASPGVYKAAAGALGFTGSDPGHPGSVLTFTCAIDAATPVACTSPYVFSGLSGGAHTLSVKAKDASDNETNPAATLAFNVDATAPTVSLDSTPAAFLGTTSAAFSFSGADDRSAVTFVCKLDTGAVSACSSPASYSSLSNALHTFTVRSVDDVGNQSAPSSFSFRVDTVAPTVTANALPLYTLASTVGLRYSGADTGSGIASYDVRYRKAPFNGAFGAPVTQWHAVTATVETMAASKGYTYCFSVLARDKAGKTSAWSAERCTATALDDRSLAASAGWARGTSSAYYGGTVTSAAAAARTLTRTSVQARHLYLVATTCRGCGTVGIYWNGTLLRSVSLNATSTTYKKVIAITDFGVARSGTLVIKTLNSGRTYIDGVTLSRA